MKNLFLFLCLGYMSGICAADLVKVNIAIVRNNQITHGNTCVIKDTGTNIVYEDERTYIEADVIEITDTNIVLRCLVSTASAENRGMLVVRGMPRLTIPLSKGLGMASLNCDGKDEHFMLIACVSPC